MKCNPIDGFLVGQSRKNDSSEVVALENNASLLELHNVTRVFRTGVYFGKAFKAVDNVSFRLGQDGPNVLVVAGESGCGKSTLAKMILGIIKPTEGRILYKGKDISKLERNEKKTFLRDVQPVFQDPFETFNPFRKLGIYLLGTALNFGIAKTKEQATEIMLNVLTRMGIDPTGILDRYPHEFSGGQLQRLSIVRALMANPSLLVADEPVSMVDASVRVEILNLFLELTRENNMSLIYITHDLSTAYYLGVQVKGQVIILYRGDVIEEGLLTDVVLRPLHPYAKMLIESLPKPNPEDRWKTRTKLTTLELAEFQAVGCKFANRCPQAKPICSKEKPSVAIVDDRKVRCWLYS